MDPYQTLRLQALHHECPTCGQAPLQPCLDVRGVLAGNAHVPTIKSIHAARKAKVV